MPSKVHERYGVPLPIDLLWQELAARYGPDVVAELRALHRRATVRYSRAAELNRRRRLVAYWERQGKQSATLDRYKEALKDPQGFIDRD